MPQVKYGGKAVTYGQKEQRPALIPLPDAKLKYAALPENVRREVYGLLEQSALIDGRPLTKLDLDKSKGKVPTEAIEKAKRLVEGYKLGRIKKHITPEIKKYVELNILLSRRTLRKTNKEER